MSSYIKWDRGAYVERVGGEQVAEERRRELMAHQSGRQPASETQAPRAHSNQTNS